MRRKKEVIEELLKALSMWESFYKPPEEIMSQFTNWLNSAGSLLHGVALRDEYDIFSDSLNNLSFSDDDSFIFHVRGSFQADESRLQHAVINYAA